MTMAQELREAKKELAKLRKQATGSTTVKRIIDFDVQKYKGKDRLLVYPNGFDESRDFNKWISLDKETVRAILISEVAENFASQQQQLLQGVPILPTVVFFLFYLFIFIFITLKRGEEDDITKHM